MYVDVDSTINHEMCVHSPIASCTYEYAKAYIPSQQYAATYDVKQALEKGTLFPELYKPYYEEFCEPRR